MIHVLINIKLKGEKIQKPTGRGAGAQRQSLPKVVLRPPSRLHLYLRIAVLFDRSKSVRENGEYWREYFSNMENIGDSTLLGTNISTRSSPSC